MYTLAHRDMDKAYFMTAEGDCRVVTATHEHVEDMYPFIRKVDQLECACMGETPRAAMLRALDKDDMTLTALDAQGVPMAMFGVGRVVGQAYIWCLGTDAVKDNAYQFLKSSRKWTQLLTKPYGATFNYVHQDNDVAIRWLKFCGAKFIRALVFQDQSFYEFIIPYRHV